MDKLVDEYLKRVVTLQTTSIEPAFVGSVLEADATTSLPKVRNLRSEQNHLERWAKDSDSLVCQVKQTLDL